MKKILILLTALLLISLVTIMAFAHSGRTDSNGGHYDHSTGEYHYHHGRSAHQHPNGVCPYSSSNDSSSNGGRIIAGVILAVIAVVIFPGALWERLWKDHIRRKKERQEREEEQKWIDEDGGE